MPKRGRTLIPAGERPACAGLAGRPDSPRLERARPARHLESVRKCPRPLDEPGRGALPSRGYRMTETSSVSHPLLPLRDIVVFPHMVVPLFVGREKSVRALEAVMKDDRQILLASQMDASEDEPEAEGDLPRRCSGQRASASETARRDREGAGRGQDARARHRLRRERLVFRGHGRYHRRDAARTLTRSRR